MEKTIEHITPKEAFALTQQDTLLVDVREVEEVAQKSYNVTHYLNLPLSELSQRYNEIPIEQYVIVTCLSGVRSQKAIALLQQQGYTKLLNLTGGITSWEKEGFPTT